MKRIFCALLVLVFAIPLFVGCDAEQMALDRLKNELNNSVWEAVSAIDAVGATVEKEEIQRRMTGLQYKFEEGGVVLCTTLGETKSGIWTVESESSVEILLGDAELTAKKTDKGLEVEYLGNTFILEEVK